MCYYFSRDFYKAHKERIHVVNGDLTRDAFGISPDSFWRMAHETDCIVHSAANVSHFGKYRDFHQMNVGAVEKLVEFAQNGIKKDIHHLSTMSIVTENVKDKEWLIFSEDECDVGQELDNYYLKTKMEAEKILLKAREKGINTNIYRLGYVTAQYDTGRFQKNIDQNAVYQIIRSIIKLGVVPALKFLVDFSFVDYVSKAFIKLFNQNNLQNETYHLYNPHEIDLFDFLSKESLGLHIRKMPVKDFFSYLYEKMNDHVLSAYVSNLLMHLTETEGITSLGKTVVQPVCDKTVSILSQLDFHWPAANKTHVRKMLEHGRNVGFLELEA